MTTIDDGDDLNALYRMVGGIVVVWGGAEQMLTAVVTLLYGEYGGRRLTMAKRHPVHLKPKLEFIERCIGAMPELEPINDDLTKIVAEFRRLAPTRHDVVHGAIASVTAKGAAFPFVKLDHDDRHIPTAREFELDAASLDPFIADLNKLTALAIRTVNWLLGPMRTRYGAIPPVNQT